MERRDFLKQSALTAAAAASAKFSAAATPTSLIARRPLGKTGEHLSMIGFGGIVVMNEDTAHSNNNVAEAVDRGVNYFDVAPQLWRRAGTSGAGPRALSQELFPRLQDRRAHEGCLA
jgi:hypothetical protein